MGARQQIWLINFNRVLIFALTLAGLLMDGVQRSDLPFTLALLVWLWLAVFTQMEAKLLRRAKRLSANTRDRAYGRHSSYKPHGTSVRRTGATAGWSSWLIDHHRHQPHAGS